MLQWSKRSSEHDDVYSKLKIDIDKDDPEGEPIMSHYSDKDRQVL